MRKRIFSSCLQKRKVIPFCFDNFCLKIGLGPNVDFFSIDELEALAKKFKEQIENKNPFDEENKEDQKRDTTMAGFFENNIK